MKEKKEKKSLLHDKNMIDGLLKKEKRYPYGSLNSRLIKTEGRRPQRLQPHRQL